MEPDKATLSSNESIGKKIFARGNHFAAKYLEGEYIWFSEVKRVCFRHGLDEKSMMRFSCFPRPSILGQRGSINLASLSGNNESNNVNSASIVSKHFQGWYCRFISNKCFVDSLHLFVEWKREEPGGNELQASWWTRSESWCGEYLKVLF